ncbi:MAG: hypothetical protein FJ292_08215 [Planctomycetes bacterium]|nr:hypothetical protein [Planctomycetota bacterium]
MRRAMQTVGWGLYLASSWTWCIGMFLPILLIRWWGWPGFLAFAVPNVLGCALFGYVLSPETSRALVARFRVWIALFGAATIAYQIGFLLKAGETAALVAALPVAFVLLVSARRGSERSDRTMMAIGACAWIASCLLFARFGGGALANLPATGTLPPSSLAWAAPFMAFGFLLCPYLDPTFHLALQRSPSRHAFAVFSAGFTVMLLFTAAYTDAGLGPGGPPSALLWDKPIFEWQWGLQAAFTIVAVVAAMRSLEPVSSLGGTRAMLPGMVVTACLALGCQYMSEPMLPPMADVLSPSFGPVPGEATYVRWLGLYGVLFPAMLLLGLRRVPPLVVVLAIAGAGFLAEFGMIGARVPLLTVAVALLMLASLWNNRKTAATEEIASADSR